MNIIKLEAVEKTYGIRKIFNSIDLNINRYEKIGLIGKNGQGKTSLLRILTGEEKADSGIVYIHPKIKIEYLKQSSNYSEFDNVLDQVFKGDSEEFKILKNYENEINKLKPNAEKILELTELMDRKNIWDLESKAKSILNRLGIDNFNEKIINLSGGQKKRVDLASVLISDSDLLILDEPTNHLDDESIEWLEEYLINLNKTLVMVTHDRYFLDRVTNRILEIDRGKLRSYEGNYNYYLKKKSEDIERKRASERKRLSLYKEELAWMNQGVKARGTRQKARVERFNKLKTVNNNLENELEIDLLTSRLGKKIIELKEISKSYKGKTIFKDFSYNFLRTDRIGIIGKNGSGKTSLMDIITKRKEADSGRVEIGETVKIGYFSQSLPRDMKGNMRSIDYIKEGGHYIENSRGELISAEKMMENFLFIGKEQYSYIGDLSGGEKRRLYLLRVLMEGANFLVFDEPTNDLDISSLNVLESYIKAFNGPVIIVSHDRYLLDKVVDKIFYINEGIIKEYPGNYSYFKEKINLKKDKTSIKKPEKKNKIKKNNRLKFSYNEQREWDLIDDEINFLEDALNKNEEELSNNTSDYKKLEKILLERKELEKKLEYKMERWLYLSELKEKIDYELGGKND